MKKYYYSTAGSPTHGPVTMEELASMNRSGEINLSTVVLEENCEGKWAPLSDLVDSHADLFKDEEPQKEEKDPEPSTVETPTRNVPPLSKAPANTSPPAIIDNSMPLIENDSGSTEYKVITLTTGCIFRTLNPVKLQRVLTSHAQDGWKLSNYIRDIKPFLIIFGKPAHFLIFERKA